MLQLLEPLPVDGCTVAVVSDVSSDVEVEGAVVVVVVVVELESLVDVLGALVVVVVSASDSVSVVDVELPPSSGIQFSVVASTQRH